MRWTKKKSAPADEATAATASDSAAPPATPTAPDETAPAADDESSAPQVGGFRFAAAACGMRFQGRDDLALIACDRPAEWAGVYTTSSAPGAPVVIGRALLAKGKPARAVLVNAGIANAGTGKLGVRDCEAAAKLAARALGVKPYEVLCSSTGRIGPRIDLRKIDRALPGLVEGLDSAGSMRAARAIMTSDSVPKRAVARCVVDGRQVTLVGISKGSGMIAPQMATTLSFVVTDAAVRRRFLQECLEEAVGASLNLLVIDGDTSTSDTCLLLASGAAGNSPLRRRHRDAAAFRAAVAEVTADLARQLAQDGEESTKLFVVTVKGAKDVAQARAAARGIVGSTLMKAAISGGRLDWGRVISSLGASGAAYVHEKLTLFFGDHPLVRKGKHLGDKAAQQALQHMAQPEIRLTVDLGLGRGEAMAFGCDLTPAYVINNSTPL